MKENPSNDIKAFFKQTKELFSRVPPAIVSQNTEKNTRSVLYAIGTGLLVNWGIHDLPNFNLAGFDDEIATLAASISAFFFGKLNDMRMLCQNEADKKQEGKVNGLNSALTGGFGGVSIASLILANKVVLLADIFLTGGIATVVGTGVGLGASYLVTNSYKTKRCPHCNHKGKCNQRVCRNCFKLFYPQKVTIDCAAEEYLDWKTIAQHLHQKRLSYLDAELLVYKYFWEWEVKKTLYGDTVLVKCESFTRWEYAHKDEIFDYIGKVKNDLTPKQAARYLDSEGL